MVANAFRGCQLRGGLCYSFRPSRFAESARLPHASLVSPQSFPQLWKKLWKSLISLEMNLWEQVLARIESKVNRHSFYTWFKPTTFVAEDARAVTVRVPNGLFKDWLTKHYSG